MPRPQGARPSGVSVVVPVHDNAATLTELCARLEAALASRVHELILVDDVSRDSSREVLARLAGPGVRVVELAARAGQSAAILAGMAHARLPATLVLDADLQDPPEAMPSLLAALDAGAPLAFAARAGPRRLSSRVFKAALRALFPALPAGAGLCFALDRDARERLLARPSAYLLASLGALGLPAHSVPVLRAQRPGGGSAYAGLRRPLHGVKMLAAALALRLRGPTAGPPSYRVQRVLGG